MKNNTLRFGTTRNYCDKSFRNQKAIFNSLISNPAVANLLAFRLYVEERPELLGSDSENARRTLEGLKAHFGITRLSKKM